MHRNEMNLNELRAYCRQLEEENVLLRDAIDALPNTSDLEMEVEQLTKEFKQLKEGRAEE